MKSFDPIWEAKYAAGHAQRYPWDAIVSFVFRNAPRDRARSDVQVLEVGCGTASNLWFAAREGFSVTGLDASESAVDTARRRFESEALSGDLRVGDFTRLPFADASFDLVWDRAALSCAERAAARLALAEIHRVLKPGGKLFFNPYSDAHSSFASAGRVNDGFAENITAGTLTGVGHVCFYSRQDVVSVLGPRWEIESLQRVSAAEEQGPERLRHEEWRVVARKKEGVR